MASSKRSKFVQIATSSAVLVDRLYTIVNALDENGEVGSISRMRERHAAKENGFACLI